MPKVVKLKSKILLRITWSFFWRQIVVVLISTAFVAAADTYLGMSVPQGQLNQQDYPEWFSYYNLFWSDIFPLIMLPYILKQALMVKYKNFRIVLIENDKEPTELTA